MQPLPPPLPPNPLAQALIDALRSALPLLMQAAIDGLASLFTALASTAWQSMIASAFQAHPLNFVTRTPPDMSYNLGGVADLAQQFQPVITGVSALACVLGGGAAMGREYLGWSWAPGEFAVRLFVGTLLGVNAIRIYTAAIDANNRILDLIVTTPLPNIPTSAIDPLTGAVVTVVWVILGFRLLVRMGYRILWLDLLLIVGPFALACWMLPGAHGYARYWIRTVVGLLIGQDLVAICLRLATVIGGPLVGTFGGLALGIGILLLAHDVATMFADIKGGGLGQVVRQTMGAMRLAGAAFK